MKTLVTLIFLCALWMNLMAQVPEKMSYQAVIRDAGGNLVVNKQVGMRITILAGILPGLNVYQETQTPTTNANGLVTIEIGGGTGFDAIQWGNINHYIKAETDPSGGTNYTIEATSPLLSVPYALYAETARTAATKVSVDMITDKLIKGGYIVADYEGNFYPVIKIGTQTWMAENLKSTRYNDGTVIPLVTDALAWTFINTPGYCWNNNDKATYGDIYGALYNWYTVNTGKLCPGGWHVPSDGEWTFLTDYLGGIYNAGGKLKEAGTTHWLSPNTGATNQSGFTALPAGIRGEEGQFTYFGVLTAFWTSTPYNELKPFYRNLNNELSSVWVGDGSLNINGFSIRCLRN